MTLDLRAAGSLSHGELAALFTACYEGYLVPIAVDEAGMRAMVETLDVDLDASLVAVLDGEPAGLANLGLRGEHGWVAGMGVVAGARRRGLGEALMRGLIQGARERGVRELRLEVLEANAAAKALYEKLGFEHARDLEIWTLAGGEPSLGEAPFDEAVARVRELRGDRAPWQCAEETLERQGEPQGWVVEGAAALGRGGSVFQAAGTEDGLRALFAGLGSARAFNVPQGPATAALESVGARFDLRQHELALRP